MKGNDDNTAAAQEEDENGPKIKMGRIGKKGRKPDQKGEAFKKEVGGREGNAMAPPSKSAAGTGFNENDIEFMKKAIQILCQSTNPLGKSIDFVTDDIDSMSKEYEHWKKEHMECQSKLDEQMRMTEEVLTPL